MSNISDSIESITSTDTLGSESYFEPEQLWSEKVRGWLIFGSIAIVLLIFFLQFTYYKMYRSLHKDINRYFYHRCLKVSIHLAFCVGVFGFIFLMVMWLALYPDVVDYHTWLETNITTVSLEENPYRCCNIVNCHCNSYSGSTSCSSLVNALEEGTCGNGYECCRTEYYDCNCRQTETCTRQGGVNNDPRNQCRTTTTCDTCSECVSSVSNERCEVVCGTCYSPEVILSYPDYDDVIHYVTITDSCSRDNYDCVEDLFAEYGGEVGYSSVGYYDPFNYNDISYDQPEINKSAVIATWFFGILVILFFIPFLLYFTYFIICKVREHHSCCTHVKSKTQYTWNSLKTWVKSKTDEPSDQDNMEMQTPDTMTIEK